MNRPPEPPLLKEKKPDSQKQINISDGLTSSRIAKHSNAQEKGLAQNAEEKLTSQRE